MRSTLTTGPKFCDHLWTPVVPPKANRVVKWEYDRTLYKRRNEVERLFRRLKGYRRIFSRFEKRDVMYRAFLNFALIVDMINRLLKKV